MKKKRKYTRAVKGNRRGEVPPPPPCFEELGGEISSQSGVYEENTLPSSRNKWEEHKHSLRYRLGT